MNRSLALLTIWLLAGSVQAQVDQRKGTDADFGKHYTLGEAAKWDLVLKSAEYSLDRVVSNDDFEVVGKDNKRVLLHFSIQNARDAEQDLSVDSMPLTIVDKEKQSHEGRRWFLVDGKAESAHMTFKPAQRIEIMAYVDVPSATVPDKLLVLPGGEDEPPILRYALTGKIKALPARHADPADTSGATPLEQLACAKGEWVQAGIWDVRVDSAADHTGKVPGSELEEGKHWYAVSITLRNGTKAAQNVFWGVLAAKLALEDETEAKLVDGLALKAAKSVETELRPAGEIGIRLIYQVEKDAKPAKLVFSDEQESVRHTVCPLADKAP